MYQIKKYQKLSIFVIAMFVVSFTITFANAAEQNNDQQIKDAMDLIKSKKIKEAIPLLEQILKNDPKNTTILKNLAVAYTELEMCDKAITVYDKILELTPNSSEIIYGKAVCLNSIGQPEQSLMVLEQIDQKFSNDISVLITKGSSHLILKEHEKAEKYLQQALVKDPNNKPALTNMVYLAIQMKDHDIAAEYLVKLFGPNPTPEELDPDFGIMPFSMQINDSKIYSVTVQMQVRNSSDDLVAIVESEKILHIPHPLMYEIFDKPKIVETIQNESGVFEIRKIILRSEPPVTPYFLDRTTLSHEGYFVFFAYNMAIPIEDGDYTITEWTIKKKIN